MSIKLKLFTAPDRGLPSALPRTAAPGTAALIIAAASKYRGAWPQLVQYSMSTRGALYQAANTVVSLVTRRVGRDKGSYLIVKLLERSWSVGAETTLDVAAGRDSQVCLCCGARVACNVSRANLHNVTIIPI